MAPAFFIVARRRKRRPQPDYLTGASSVFGAFLDFFDLSDLDFFGLSDLAFFGLSALAAGAGAAGVAGAAFIGSALAGAGAAAGAAGAGAGAVWAATLKAKAAMPAASRVFSSLFISSPILFMARVETRCAPNFRAVCH